MKFTLSWLKSHLETNASSLEDISKTLTAIGLEVESITDNSEVLRPFTVAEILHAEQHPNADKLRVCKVNTGSEELQIVCGAPNARAGIKVILAKEGMTIPTNGMKLKKTAIRGVESNGMLCSARELGLGNDHDGIMELLANAKLGESIVTVLGLDDPLIEIAITPDRADCLGVYGVARDLSAAGMGTLKPLKIEPVKGSFDSKTTVTITDTNGCKQFVGRTIRGVKNGESPEWLKRRLTAIGLRPISALVDITNYFTYDLGRPLHVYDTAKLKGDITVRASKNGEILNALNNNKYTLQDGMCAITDESGVIGLGGIIGGVSTGCQPETTELFLEVAYFNPENIAYTGRKLGIDSDARYRFERGVDPAFLQTGAELATKMILELCGGEAGTLVIAGKEPEWQHSIAFDPERVKLLGGVDLPEKEIFAILEKLGFQNKAGTIIPPSWRGDVHDSADLVEEVLRIYSYDNIPALPLPKPATTAKPALSLAQKRVSLAKRTLAAQGLTECCTWSFLPRAQAQLFGGGDASLVLQNPINSELDTMRPGLLANLITVARRNTLRSFKNNALFEVGTVFQNATPEGQPTHAAGIRTGSIAAHNVHKTERDVDIFDAKADAFAVLETLGLNPAKLQITTQTPGWYHPGRSGAITLGGKIILAYFGELHPSILQQLDFEEKTIGFELFITAIPEPRAKGKSRPALQVSDFQPVGRDFAFIVGNKVTAAEILKSIEGAEKTLIREVSIFDIYQGKGVEEGKKSVALSVTLQASDRTLTEEEITAVAKKIVEAAEKSFGGKLRA